MRLKPTIVRFAAAPFVAYVRHFPVKRGKGFLLRRVLAPLLGSLGEVEFRIPPRGRVWLSMKETLGLSWMVYGPFEAAEREYASRVVASGSGWAIDVGANVGVFSVAIAQALGPDAQLIAVEPLADNVGRMRRHLSASGIDRVSIVQAALSSQPGYARLWRTPDAAYASLVNGQGPGAEAVNVEVTTLDDVWVRYGRPPVSIVKIDIEGAEVEALRGGALLLAACRPVLLIEIDDDSRMREIESLLSGSGYRRSIPPGFEPWNHVFTAAGSS